MQHLSAVACTCLLNNLSFQSLPEVNGDTNVKHRFELLPPNMGHSHEVNNHLTSVGEPTKINITPISKHKLVRCVMCALKTHTVCLY